MFHLLIYFQYGLTVSVIGQFLRALAVLTIDSKLFELADVTSGLRGHSLKLFKPRCRTTVRQNFFSLWIVNEWDKATTGHRGGTVNQHVQEQAGSTLARYGHSKLTAT